MRRQKRGLLTADVDVVAAFASVSAACHAIVPTALYAVSHACCVANGLI